MHPRRALAVFVAVSSSCSFAFLAPPAAAAGPCVPSLDVGCSNHNRFRVEVAWQNQFNGASGAGVVVRKASTDETLAFSFGDPANIELLVKILNFGDVVKLFYGELTDLHFQATVTDTAHGTVKTYSNTPGDCGAIDGAAFPGQRSEPKLGHRAGLAGAGACRPSPTTLCLLDGRFAASVTWENQFNGSSGAGMAGALSSLTGTFFFSDPSNKELMVKVLDLGERIGVFYGSLSNLQYALTVTDTQTGKSKVFVNPAGTFCGGLDSAFPANLVASTLFNLVPVSPGAVDDIALAPFTTTVAGNLEVNADWTSAADHVELVLFRGVCTLAEAIQNQCDPNQIAASRDLVKPQRLLQANLAAGTYTVMVINFGPNHETGAMSATLTP